MPLRPQRAPPRKPPSLALALTLALTLTLTLTLALTLTLTLTLTKDVSFVSLRFPNIIKTERWAELPWAAPTADAPMPLLLWAYAAEEDVVDAHVQAVVRPEAAAAGTHEAYILAAPTTRFAEPTLELLGSALGMAAPPPIRAGVSPISPLYLPYISPISRHRSAQAACAATRRPSTRPRRPGQG